MRWMHAAPSIGVALLVAATWADSAEASLCQDPTGIAEIVPSYHLGAECRQVNFEEGMGLVTPLIRDTATIYNASTEREQFVCPLDNNLNDRTLP